ncbi:MAG: DTW domain-containing protein [Halobacteriovoraceae bacterium]|nr:DTW domain-containing protein [Halobacteriovoraceae bacterium]MCB9095203.1 DTW domain-containing protein [Halobacteriovoraceae bacterium]
MKSFEPRRVHCLKCLRPQKICFCSEIKSFNTQFEFVILMHPKEAKKQRLGTGRMTHVALTNSQIIVDEEFDTNKSVQKLLKDPNVACFLLYPGKNSLNLTKEKFEKSRFVPKRPVVFILDGTWPCAKSMLRKSRTLQTLPRLSFDPPRNSQFTIKHQPADYCLSTIESVYYLLANLEAQGIEKLYDCEKVLLECLQRLVDFQIACAKDPNKKSYKKNPKPYKEPWMRKKSKKWESRNICFET